MERNKTALKTKQSILDVTLTAMFTAVTAVLSQIAIPIGPVPISCSLIAVYLSGILLTPKLAVLSQIVYLLLGAVGVPVFANFGAGLAKLAGPTGGYLVVYPILALCISLCMRVYDRHILPKQNQMKHKTALAQTVTFMVAVLSAALLLCYLTGTLWFVFYAGASFQKALSLTVIPFIAGDIVKIILCTILTVFLRPLFLKSMKKHRPI